MRRIVTALIVIAIACGSGALVAYAHTGTGYNHNAGQDQYKEKPGCGPWKSDGYAGYSGQHTGQPPKGDDREDCPKPPGGDCWSQWWQWSFYGYGYDDGRHYH